MSEQANSLQPGVTEAPDPLSEALDRFLSLVGAVTIQSQDKCDPN